MFGLEPPGPLGPGRPAERQARTPLTPEKPLPPAIESKRHIDNLQSRIGVEAGLPKHDKQSSTLAIPTGQLIGFCRTSSQTLTTPVRNPNSSPQVKTLLATSNTGLVNHSSIPAPERDGTTR